MSRPAALRRFAVACAALILALLPAGGCGSSPVAEPSPAKESRTWLIADDRPADDSAGLGGRAAEAVLRTVSDLPQIDIRTVSEDTERLVVAPADGKIVVIEEVEENEYFHERRLMVSIFMSLFNVHANWFPVDGKVKFVNHRNGNFHKAWLPKASEENEHADIMITTPEGTDILCRQIAGAVARRIVTYAKPGEECFIDEHLGFIKFGSRVDVYLPIGTEVCVKMGQTTTGDQTVIAKLKD